MLIDPDKIETTFIKVFGFLIIAIIIVFLIINTDTIGMTLLKIFAFLAIDAIIGLIIFLFL
jgi:hypothetical protein